MTSSRTLAVTAVIAAAVLVNVPAAAHAAKRPPIKDCGDVATLDEDQVFVGAITAQGGTCTNARQIANQVAKSRDCKRTGSCRVRNFTCLLAKAGKELTLVHCDSTRQTAVVRFEFGS